MPLPDGDVDSRYPHVTCAGFDSHGDAFVKPSACYTWVDPKNRYSVRVKPLGEGAPSGRYPHVNCTGTFANNGVAYLIPEPCYVWVKTPDATAPDFRTQAAPEGFAYRGNPGLVCTGNPEKVKPAPGYTWQKPDDPNDLSVRQLAGWEVVLAHGHQLLIVGRYEAAASEYRRAYAACPGPAGPDCLNVLDYLASVLLWDLHRLDESGSATFLLAGYSDQLGREFSALAARAHGLRSAWFSATMHFSDAEREARTAIRLYPQDYWGHALLGDALDSQGRDSEAIGAFADAIRVSRGRTPSWVLNHWQILQNQLNYKIQQRHPYERRAALVLGGTDIYGANIGSGEAKQAIRARMDQLILAQAEAGGVSAAEFLYPGAYDFVVGIALSNDLFTDLRKRMFWDEISLGGASAKASLLYPTLKGRDFDRLDCHSNGAMVCLHAIEVNDTTARHVRLLGPQVTATSLVHWQRLLANGRVRSVELYIVEGDPVPFIAFTAGSALDGWRAPNSVTLRSAVVNLAPGIKLHILPCPAALRGTGVFACHNVSLYQSQARP